MATNRYTNITPSQFNPLSMQEIMLVPTLKRQQHDAAIAGMEQLRDLQADPLKVHEDKALQIKSDFENKINERVEQLNREGYNPSIVSDLSRLNKEYKDLISPTGEIGKINAANKAMSAEKKDFMDSAQKENWSKETALRNWNNRHLANYTGFDEDGNITSIGSYGSPKKIELMEKLKDMKSLLGEQVVSEIAAGNYQIGEREDGSLQIVNRSGRRIETSNDPGIQHGLAMLLEELRDPNSEWRKSLDFEGVSLDRLVRQVDHGTKAMLSEKVTDNRSQNVSVQGYKNAKEDKISGARPMAIQRTTNPFEKFGMNAKQGVEEFNRLSQLEADGNLSPAESTRYEEMRGAFNMYEEQFQNDPELRENYEELENALKAKEHLLPPGVTPDKVQSLNDYWEINMDENGHLTDVNKAGKTVVYKDIVAWKQSKHSGGKDPIVIDGKFVYSGDDFDAVQKYLKETSQIRKDKEQIEEDVWKNTSIQNNYYTQMGITPNDTKLIKNIEENVAIKIASTPGGIDNLANLGLVQIHTISDDGKTRKKLKTTELQLPSNAEYVNTMYSDNNTPVFIYKSKNTDGTYTKYEVAQTTDQLVDHTGNFTPYGFIIQGLKDNGSTELAETLENNAVKSRVRTSLYGSGNNPKSWSIINSDLQTYFGNDVSAWRKFREKYNERRAEGLIARLKEEGREDLIEKSYYHEQYKGNYPKDFEDSKKLTTEDQKQLKEYQSISNDEIDNSKVDPFNDFK